MLKRFSFETKNKKIKNSLDSTITCPFNPVECDLENWNKQTWNIPNPLYWRISNLAKPLIFIAPRRKREKERESPLSTSITIEVKFLNGPLPRLLRKGYREILSRSAGRTSGRSRHERWLRGNPFCTGYREPMKPGVSSVGGKRGSRVGLPVQPCNSGLRLYVEVTRQERVNNYLMSDNLFTIKSKN